jgi:hypothetical protein
MVMSKITQNTITKTQEIIFKEQKDYSAAIHFLGTAYMFSLLGTAFAIFGWWTATAAESHVEDYFIFLAFNAGAQVLATLIATSAIGKAPRGNIWSSWSIFFLMLLISLGSAFYALLALLKVSVFA